VAAAASQYLGDFISFVVSLVIGTWTDKAARPHSLQLIYKRQQKKLWNPRRQRGFALSAKLETHQNGDPNM
jgi:hypothetical protein